MAGYLGQLGQPGMREDHGGGYCASGYGLLSRDVTALEENDRGWENLPPWGYKRNRPQDNAPPRVLDGAAADILLRRAAQDIASAEIVEPGAGTALAGWLELARGRGQQAGWLELSRGRQAGWLELSRGRGTQGEWLELPPGSRVPRGRQGEWLELPAGARPPRGRAAGHPTVLVQSRGQVSGLGACCNGCSSGHGCVSGLGSLGATSANALEAANAFAEAILDSGVFGTSLDGVRPVDLSRGNGFLKQVSDSNMSEAIWGYALSGANAAQSLIDYGNDEGMAASYIATAQAAVAGLRSIAAGQPVQQVAGDEWTDVDPAAVKAASGQEDLSWLQSLGMSDAGAGIITAGAFTSGVTGINQDAIMEQAGGSDIDVGTLIKQGQAARDSALSMGKYAAYIGVAVVAYFAAKKAGVI